MKYISHRGNLTGPDKSKENTPEQIDLAIGKGFYVEVDVWVKDQVLYLGHDLPSIEVDIDWILERKDFLYIHCKNIEAITFLQEFSEKRIHYFWHEEDTLTLTSFGYIWAYPGKQPIRNSIAVMPEIYNDDVSSCSGICTDYPIKYSMRD